ncbi:MAG: hypothetical protein ACKVZJ_14390 [Phycisphaerales bacterium]
MINKTLFVAALALCAGSAVANPTPGTMYAVDSNRSLYTIDFSTGAKTLIGTIGTNSGTPGGLAYRPDNNTIYLTSTSTDSLYTLDVTTATSTLVGAYGGADVVMHGLEWDSSTGTMYGVSGGGSPANFNAYTISTANGAATLLGNTGLTSFTNLGYNSLTNTMYATNSATDSFFTFNRATGGTTLIGALGGPTNPNGLAFNRDNGLMYMVDNNTDSLYTINMNTGAATLVGSTGSGNLLGLVYVPIPTPGAASLLAIAGAATLRRRRA